MVKALTIGVSVMAGILIGRIQIIENHTANDAVASAERASQRAAVARRDAIATRALLDRTERHVVTMWRRLEPMLEDFTQADSTITRYSAYRRIQSLRSEMDTLDASITASRELLGEDERTAMRQVFIKQNFGR